MRLFVRLRLSYPLRDRVATVSVSRNRVSYSPDLPRFYLPGATRIVGIQRFPT
jgi:hypothetical protein